MGIAFWTEGKIVCCMYHNVAKKYSRFRVEFKSTGQRGHAFGNKINASGNKINVHCDFCENVELCFVKFWSMDLRIMEE